MVRGPSPVAPGVGGSVTGGGGAHPGLGVLILWRSAAAAVRGLSPTPSTAPASAVRLRHFAHLSATSDFSARSQAVGFPETAGVT